MTDHTEPKPFFKKRIHILIEGTDRELVYDTDPGYEEASMLTKVLKQAEEHLRTRGLQGTMKVMEGIEPDATIIPNFTIMDSEHEVLVTPHVIKCEAAERLSEIRATILVNFGPEGKKHNGITVKKDKSVLKMLVSILQMYSDLVEHVEGLRPKYQDQVVTQGALNALIHQRDTAWRERYKDRLAVLKKLYDRVRDDSFGNSTTSIIRTMIREEEEKIPPEPECKTIIHAMAEHPDSIASLITNILLWAGGAKSPMPVPNEHILKLAKWMDDHGYIYEEYT
jgi:hypothetical protein